MYVFISDLHLSSESPRLMRGFFALLTHYQHATSPVHLYILGDWFNAWIGDDAINTPENAWIQPIITALQTFQHAGHQLYFIAGNRDFTLGQAFLAHFHGTLLPEMSDLTIAGKTYRLEHGDLLCTDDVQYQRFRKIIRSRLVLTLLYALPVNTRQRIAHYFRTKSKQQNQRKDWNIMDVNPLAVQHALENVDVLIHGHTHRPDIHHFANKKRIVLGDWREQETNGTAMILEIDENGNENFKCWTFE